MKRDNRVCVIGCWEVPYCLTSGKCRCCFLSWHNQPFRIPSPSVCPMTLPPHAMPLHILAHESLTVLKQLIMFFLHAFAAQLFHLPECLLLFSTWQELRQVLTPGDIGVHCFIFCASQSCIWVSGRTLNTLPYNYLSPLDCVVLSARDSFLFILFLLSMYLVIFYWINQWMGRE